MPRSSRLDAPGILHHVIARGIERRQIFTDTTDRKSFLCRLAELIDKTGMKCYAWCLMSNHLHLLLRTAHTPLSSFMRRLLTGHAVSFNLRQRRTGHLFQNRYKSILCEEEPYLLELIRYIHLNPIRAGVVETISELDKYLWTGHTTIMGKTKYKWQETNEVLLRFGRKSREARKKYQEFVVEGIGRYKSGELSCGGLIRSAGGIENLSKRKEKEQYDERILGSGDFVEGILRIQEEIDNEKARIKKKDIGFKELAKRVKKEYGIEDLLSGSRKGKISDARAVISFLSVNYLGLSLTEVGRRLSISRQAVSVGVSRGEKIFSENSSLKDNLLG